MMFQRPTLFEGSVADNITYRAALRGEGLLEDKVVDIWKNLGCQIRQQSICGASAEGGLGQGSRQRA